MTVPDGSVVLDTGLDTEGFEAGSSDLLNAIKKLASSMDSLSEIMLKAFTGTGAVLQRAGDSAARAGDRTERSAAKAAKTLEEMEGTAERLRQEMEHLEGAEIPTDQYAKAAEEFEQYNRLFQEAQASRDAMKDHDGWDFASATIKLNQYADKVLELHAQLKELENLGQDFQLGEQSAYYQQLRTELEAVEAEIQRVNEAAALEGISAGIAKASNEADRFQAKVDKMSELGAADRQWDSVAYDISLAAENAEQLREELENLGRTETISAEDYERLSEELEAIMGQFRELQEAASVPEPEPAHMERWNSMVTLSQMLDRAFSELKITLQEAGHAVIHPVETADRALALVVSKAREACGVLLQMAGGVVQTGLRNLARSAAETAKNLTRIAVTSVVTGFRRMSKAASDAAMSLARLTSAPMLGGIRRLGAWLSNGARSMLLFGDGAKSADRSLGASLLTLLKYSLGIRGLYALVRRISSAIKEGFGNLAQYSDNANRAISSVQSALGQLKNQMAASFSPILQTAAPALVTLINLLTQATAALGAFFAALTGRSVMLRAAAMQQNFANSLNSTGKAAKNAVKQLAAFDELNILKTKDDSGAGGGAGGVDPANLFQEVPIDSNVQEFVERVKAAWAASDFTEIGGIIGRKFKDALESIPWQPIQDTAGRIGRSAATLLNGIFETPGLFSTVGLTLAEAIHTAFSLADNFVWNFHFDSLGHAVLDAVQGACGGLDWSLIEHTLNGVAAGTASLFNVVFSRPEVFAEAGNALGHAVSAAVGAGLAYIGLFDFSQAANAIAAGVNAAVSEIHWDDTGRLLGGLIGGSLQFLHAAVTGFDWRTLASGFASGVNALVTELGNRTANLNWGETGANLAAGLNKAIQSVSWANLGGLMARLFNGSQDFLYQAVTSFQWAENTAALASGIERFIRDVDWNRLSETLKRLFLGVLDGIFVAASLVDWHELGLQIGDFIGDAADYVLDHMDEIIRYASDFIAGLIEGIGPEKINAAIGIVLAAVTAYLLGSAVMGALTHTLETAIAGAVSGGVKAIAAGTPQITGAVAATGGSIAAALGGIAATVATAALGVADALLVAYDAGALADAASTYHEAQETHNRETKTALECLEKLYREKGPDIAAEWAKTVYEIDISGKSLEESQRLLTEKVDSLWDDVPQNMWEGFRQGWTHYFGGNGQKGAGLFALLSDAFTGAVNGIRNLLGIHSPSTVFAEIGRNIALGVKEGFSNMWRDAAAFFSASFEDLRRSASETWEEIRRTASDKWHTIQETITDKFTKTREAILTTAGNLHTDISRKWEEIHSGARTAWENVRNTASTSFANAKNTLVTTAQNLHSDLNRRWEEVKASAKTTWETVRTNAAATFNNAKSDLISTAQNIYIEIGNRWESVKSSAKAAWENVRQTASDNLNTARESLLASAENIRSGLAEKWDRVRDAASEKWTAVSSTIHGLMDSLKTSLANKDWSEIGRNLAYGIRNGISNAWDTVSSKVRSLASGLTRTVRDAFVINSPSKIWTGIGEYLDLGLVQGIEDHAKNVLAAVRNLASAVSGEMRAEGDISVNASSVNAAVDGFADRIAEGVFALAETLQAIADKISFHAPEIAMGTVLPYRVAAAAEGPSGGETYRDRSERRIAEIIELLENLLDETRKNRPVSGSGSPDMRSLARNVARQLDLMDRTHAR